MTPVERAARAAMVAQGCGLTKGGERVFCDSCDCYDIVRAVLQAIREPSEAMLEAYGDAADDSDGPAAMHLQVQAYRAMIDAALAETEQK